MIINKQVWIGDLRAGYTALVNEALRSVGFFTAVPAPAHVFLKPNLTFPGYRPGVMTSYECLEAVVECLVGKGYQVTIGEADSGGYNRFAMDSVFEQMGIKGLAERTGARLVNLSYADPKVMDVRVGGKTLHVSVPRLLFDEIDAFISLPVPKIHMNTLVSMSIKNQWGCIREPSERLRLHPYFAEVMFEFNRRLPHAYSIIDGRFGLNRSGPLRGDVVELNWLLASNDLVAADRACCRLMQVDERKIGYLRYFKKMGWWSPFEEVRLNRDLGEFVREKFYLRRAWTDYPGVVCFYSPFLAWLGYRSPLAGALHRALYLFRESFYDYEKEGSKVGAVTIAACHREKDSVNIHS